MACGGLEGDGIHAGDLTEQVLGPVQDGLSSPAVWAGWRGAIR